MAGKQPEELRRTLTQEMEVNPILLYRVPHILHQSGETPKPRIIGVKK